jgi:hypothetical protein
MPAGEDPCKLLSIYRARNVKIPQAIIESNARWRKVERGRGKQLAVEMMEHYSDVVAMVETLLQYSRAICWTFVGGILVSGQRSLCYIDEGMSP